MGQPERTLRIMPIVAQNNSDPHRYLSDYSSSTGGVQIAMTQLRPTSPLPSRPLTFSSTIPFACELPPVGEVL